MGCAHLYPCFIFLINKIYKWQLCARMRRKFILKKLSLSGLSGVSSHMCAMVHNNIKIEHQILQRKLYVLSLSVLGKLHETRDRKSVVSHAVISTA